MTAEALIPYLFIGAGAALFALGIPKFRDRTIGRLQEKDILPKPKITPKSREILYGAGPHISLMLLGAILIVTGITLLVKK